MYPKRYDLLDKDGKVLGWGIRPRKWARLIISLPFLEYCRWKAGGCRIRERLDRNSVLTGITNRDILADERTQG